MKLITRQIKVALICLVIIVLSCKSESKKIEKTVKFPSFKTVSAMLEDASDYYEENGSLKFISQDANNFHVQVSKGIFKNDLEKVKKEIVNRDIIYVAFQTFAQTDLNKITITSIPLNSEKPKTYFDKYQKTVSVSREKAKSILKKYLNEDNFSSLYSFEDGYWLPNKKFSKLKFEKLNEVIADIEN